MKYIDFHIHTKYSDGTEDPKSIVRAARLNGLDALAITDHDEFSGYFEAKEESRLWNIRLIPGIEFSVQKYHILGLNFDPKNKSLIDFVSRIKSHQFEECRERVKILRNYGVPITIGGIATRFPNARLGKYNIQMTLISDQECVRYLEEKHENIYSDDIFHYYLGKQGVAGKISLKNPFSPEEAINRIHDAGGIAVLAHPFKEVGDTKEIDLLLSSGLDAIEIQPNYNGKNTPFREYASEKGIPIVYGSDYHGPTRGRPLLGRGENKIDLGILTKKLEVTA